ncbi:hypothetical protein [Hymenobacter sp. BT491]|uniref:hypothetical protein n=1 Tax=Hymenobacter sp. BT491 TaxID=2766779 RepID=UPI0016536E1B|nr:hypothetical protein [Hymenobacter sp. BT491]MBC6989373.1 hypothetical protein [Hymenobacter sp. BT491]
MQLSSFTFHYKVVCTLALGAGFVLLSACQDEKSADPACSTPATIHDLTGLDGCRFVLELSSGKRLEPAGEAWTAYTPHDGEKVYIAYTDDPRASICMVGQTVKLVCIRAR